MATTKKTVTEKVAPQKVEKKADSEAKIEFRSFLEVYKESNPEKYEAKKATLEAKLESL